MNWVIRFAVCNSVNCKTLISFIPFDEDKFGYRSGGYSHF